MIDAYDPQCETPDAICMRGAMFAMTGQVDDASRMLQRLEDLAGTALASAVPRHFREGRPRGR